MQINSIGFSARVPQKPTLKQAIKRANLLLENPKSINNIVKGFLEPNPTSKRLSTAMKVMEENGVKIESILSKKAQEGYLYAHQVIASAFGLKK